MKAAIYATLIVFAIVGGVGGFTFLTIYHSSIALIIVQAFIALLVLGGIVGMWYTLYDILRDTHREPSDGDDYQ